ncbi:cytochrome P450 [Ascobolus immersus RN42]|uniref:Cytochrome P450 n=1 Tax=Ascobolus immersus RN42 TaxID=1160509 RepID=A0A3N4I8D0_ASCIM|nr:cytochrome P450 [Ascobolus immersus RN42]
MDFFSSRIIQHFLATEPAWLLLEILLPITLWLGAKTVYNLYFHPLSHLPSPPFASVTSLVLVYYSHYDLRTETLAKWHRIYGPIVRIAPNEVSFTSQKAVKEIYQDPEMEKCIPLYGIFQHFGADNAFTSRTRHEHGWRRKGVADRYTLTYVMSEEEKEGKIRRAAKDYCAFVENEAVPVGEKKNSWDVDLYAANIFYATDNITSHLFGEDLGSHALRQPPFSSTNSVIPADADSMRKRIFAHYGAALRSKVYLYVAFPAVMNVVDYFRKLRIALFPVAGELVDGLDRMREFGWKRQQYLKESKDTRTVAGKLSMLVDAGSREWSDEVAGSELMDHILAGMDTTSDTLSFLMYHISHPNHESIQKELRDELRRSITGSPYDAPLSLIMGLPYLSAVIFETLRVYTAIPVTLPRVVTSPGKTIDGISIPVGTVVGSLAKAIHQDDDIYSGDGQWPVDEFLPERWLTRKGINNEGERIKKMENRLWAFGSGARGCVGRHLAMVEMKVLLAVVYWTYQTTLVPHTTIKLPHNQWNQRRTFRDTLPFKGANGILRFTRSV